MAEFYPVTAAAVVNGPVLPASCQPGQVFFLTAGLGADGLYECLTANNWTIVAGGGGGGSGTVTTVSVVTANGVSGSVANPTTTPAITLTLGAITPTTVNKVTITAPATGSTLTIADGKTLTASNTLTFTGTDSSTVAFGAGGTPLYNGGALGTPSSGTLTNATGYTFANLASPPFVTNPKTATYQVLAADFTQCKVIPVASGTFTITLVASTSQPAAGQYIRIMNYGTGVVTVARSGQNINGATTSILVGRATNLAATGVDIISDGTNYFAVPIGGWPISTFGTTNIFCGPQNGGAGLSSGVENTGFGYNVFASLSGSTTSNNTAYGAHALEALTGGGNNTAVGDDAGRSITTGQHNTYMGKDAGELNVTANNNTGIGEGALDGSTAADNTAVGFHAGLNSTTNSDMTYLGNVADASPLTGLVFGTAIGASCIVNNSYTVVLGGHLGSHQTHGTTSVAGTGFTLTYGNDNAGVLTLSVGATVGAITFANAFKQPVVTVSGSASGIAPIVSALSTSGFSVTVAAAAGIVYYTVQDVN